MASTPGKRRKPARSGASKNPSTVSNPLHHSHPRAQSLFSTNKKDKRIIKHSALISRIEKSKPYIKKRRRPSKKLVANLESLAAALPDAPAATAADAFETATAKIKPRSLKSKPGAMKKKERIISMEKDRFNKNMAQLSTIQQSDVLSADQMQAAGISPDLQPGTKWAALRSFIQQTME
ncbi:MAG: hypothetical protein L6R39_001493 [Caloplaca ligustica]|nr:MAG: hypothetical protein L6R39_001493 [Caloplaca ligustica]